MRRLRTILALGFISVTILLAAPPPKPKLVLAIAIDQFRYDYLLRFRKDYNSGLARLLEHGAVFTDAHYPQAMTVTAVGHSTFLTGATPSMSGIIANEWYDRATRTTVTSVSDPETKLAGTARTGSSPRRLLVSTVGDELKSQGGDSKVIGISIKDRSAILPAGHMADAAYWYDDTTHAWVTSTFYRDALPGWAQEINSAGPEKKYAGMKWVPFDNPSAAPICVMGSTQSRLCRSVETAPWGNEMIEDFAEHAINGENLGRHTSTDILAVSFSANDYVGHAVGPDDPAVRDMSIRTDRLLGKLFDFADRAVGSGNVLVVLTADHGVAPVPEVNQRRKMPGGRLNAQGLIEKINAALSAHFGPGKWVISGSPVNLYLNQDLIAQQKLDPAQVERAAVDAIATEPHIARVVTRHDLAMGRVQQDLVGHAMTVGFFGPRSGDVFVLQEPYYLFDNLGTSHGTPYDYDTHVPVIFMGAGIKAAIYARPIAPNDIAPTLSAILGVAQPGGSVGHVLTELVQ